MKYYCPECKSEIDTEFIDLLQCPICHGYSIGRLPDFETPSQYEKRTGKKWNGAVWFRYKTHTDRYKVWSKWQAHNPVKDWSESYTTTQWLCASSPEPPPDDYVPEVEA